MKKVLVAGAALLIAGSMVSAASAEVNLSGDARARYVGTSDYDRDFNLDTNSTDKNGYKDRFDSRIRVKFDGKANGGAWMKTRLEVDNITWDGQGGAGSETNNIWADYAYIGVPMGPVTVVAGRQEASFSEFFSWDGRPTRLKVDWKVGKIRIIPILDVSDENVNALDDWNDNDFMAYAVVGSLKINDDWSVKAYARYHDDQREIDESTGDDGTTVLSPHTDKSGLLGSIHANGKVGMVGLEAEIAYKEADVIGSADDAWGWYFDGSLDLGRFQPSLMLGGTYDGYLADDDFGFIMVGADEPITKIAQLGVAGGDSYFAALVTKYAVSDQLKLAGNFAYFDYDAAGIDRIANAWEISGSATYVISEGADLTYKLGYLSPDVDGQITAQGLSDDGYFGHYLRMAIKF